MLDYLSVFTKGGVVLWSKMTTPIPDTAVDGLVQNVLLEERSGQDHYKHDRYTFKWTFQNDLDLVFVAVYFHLSQFLNIDDLLNRFKNEFVAMFRNDIRMAPLPRHFVKFDTKFDEITDNVENAAADKKLNKPRSFGQTKKGNQIMMDKGEDAEPARTPSKPSKGDKPKPSKNKGEDDDEEGAETAPAPNSSTDGNNNGSVAAADPVSTHTSSTTPITKKKGAVETSDSTPALSSPSSASAAASNEQASSPAQLLPRGVSAAQMAKIAKEKMMLAKTGGAGSKKAPKKAEEDEKKPEKPEKKKKVMAPSKKPTAMDLDKLDYTNKIDPSRTPSSSTPASALPPLDGGFGPPPAKDEQYIDGQLDSDDEGAEEGGDDQGDESGDEETQSDSKTPSSSSSRRTGEEKTPASASGKSAKPKASWFSYFKSLATSSQLTRENLEPVLEKFKSNLMSKNVAQEISEKLCESVLKSLEGKTIGTFTTVKSTVKEAIEQSLTRILTPSKPIDVLQGIMAARDQKRPYSIVFVGVNGVGKSTSLSKVGAYFISKSLKVGIVACDTFRSGAIEQLKTHATALGVPLYDRGYNRDPAGVAAEGIAQAQKDGRDVVLIDTAGRMQDNEPLMRALSKLITVNKPDLVLFVGEALVGNDGVDQLTKFNRCLIDLSETATPRLIDGIVLTKFDTIDDKVGAAISMTYTTGQPIMFVGTGQTYKDLRRMNVKLLIRSLLR